ncbi:MAG: hypothetical protein Q4D90_01015 [bacterium]|nr:hypothetical protein [bacterium]
MAGNKVDKLVKKFDEDARVQAQARAEAALTPDLRRYDDAIKGGRLSEVFDSILGAIPKDNSLNEDPDYKNIYIDGKNAFETYQAQFGDDADRIKRQIMNDLMDGSHRVEVVRLENMGANIPPRISFLPLKPDLTYLDETQKKKWYQSSRVKTQKGLWEKDPRAEERHREMEKHASERYVARHNARLIRGEEYKKYMSKWHDDMDKTTNETVAAHKASPSIMEAKAKLVEKEKLEKKWISLKNEAFQNESAFNADASKKEELKKLDQEIMGMTLSDNPTPSERFRYLQRSKIFLEAGYDFSVNALESAIKTDIDISKNRDTMFNCSQKLKAIEELYNKQKGLTQEYMGDYINSLPAEEKRKFEQIEQWKNDFTRRSSQTPDSPISDMDSQYMSDYLQLQTKAAHYKAGNVDQRILQTIEEDLEKVGMKEISKDAVDQQIYIKQDKNFRQTFGKDVDEFAALHNSTAYFEGHFSRTLTGLGIVTGLLLNEGHKITDINDPTKLLDEKHKAAERLENALGAIDDPEHPGLVRPYSLKMPDNGGEEEIGALLADSAKGFSNLDLPQVVEEVTGLKIETKEDLKEAFENRLYMPKIAAALQMISPAQQEVHKLVQDFLPSWVILDKQPSGAEFDASMDKKPKWVCPIYSAFLDHMSDEDLKKRENSAQVMDSLREENRLENMVQHYAGKKELSDKDLMQTQMLLGEVLQEVAEKGKMENGKLALGDVDTFSDYHSLYARKFKEAFGKDRNRQNDMLKQGKKYNEGMLDESEFAALRDRLVPASEVTKLRKTEQERKQSRINSMNNYVETVKRVFSRITPTDRANKKKHAEAVKASTRKMSFSKLCSGTETAKAQGKSNAANQKSSTKGMDSKTNAIKSPEVSVRRK